MTNNWQNQKNDCLLFAGLPLNTMLALEGITAIVGVLEFTECSLDLLSVKCLEITRYDLIL